MEGKFAVVFCGSRTGIHAFRHAYRTTCRWSSDDKEFARNFQVLPRHCSWLCRNSLTHNFLSARLTVKYSQKVRQYFRTKIVQTEEILKRSVVRTVALAAHTLPNSLILEHLLILFVLASTSAFLQYTVAYRNGLKTKSGLSNQQTIESESAFRVKFNLQITAIYKSSAYFLHCKKGELHEKDRSFQCRRSAGFAD